MFHTTTTWQTLGEVDPGLLSQTRQQIHWAVQLLGQVGLGFQDAHPDWLHYTLNWQAMTQCFSSQEVTGERPFRLDFDCVQGTLYLQSKEKTLAHLNLSGKNIQDSHKWLLEQLTELGYIDINLPEIPHEMPSHELQTEASFVFDTAAARALSSWFHNAFFVLAEVQKNFPDQPPLVCWPHHFDVATLQHYPEIEAGQVNAGFSPGDDYYTEPYFYVTPWPHTSLETLKVEDLPALPTGAFWRTEGWLGAILTGSALLKNAEPEPSARTFLNTAVTACEQIVKQE